MVPIANLGRSKDAADRHCRAQATRLRLERNQGGLSDYSSELLDNLPQVVGVFCDDLFNLLLARISARRRELRRVFGTGVTFVVSVHGPTLDTDQKGIID